MHNLVTSLPLMRQPSRQTRISMGAKTSSALALAFTLAASVFSATTCQAADTAPTSKSYMVVDQEPYHRLIQDLGRYRIFDVEVPSGATTAFHLHHADNFSVRVNNSTFANETLDGKVTQVTATPGSLTYGTASVESPYGHRLSTTSATSFRTIMIEVKKPLPSATPEAEALPAAYALVKETPRGRLYKLTLPPGQSLALPQRGEDLLLVSQGENRLSLDGTTPWPTKVGDFKFMSTHPGLSLRNDGQTEALVSVLALF